MKPLVFLLLASINLACFGAIQATKYYVDTQIRAVNDTLPSIISNTVADLRLPTVQTNYVETIFNVYSNTYSLATKLYNNVIHPNCAGSVYIISNDNSSVYEKIYIGESNFVEHVEFDGDYWEHDIFKAYGPIKYVYMPGEDMSNMWQKSITAKRYFAPATSSRDAYYEWTFSIQELQALLYNGVIYTNIVRDIGFQYSPRLPNPLPFPFNKGEIFILKQEKYPYNETGYILEKFNDYDVEFDSYLGDNYSLISMMNGKIDSVAWKSDLSREVNRLNSAISELQIQISNSSGAHIDKDLNVYVDGVKVGKLNVTSE